MPDDQETREAPRQPGDRTEAAAPPSDTTPYSPAAVPAGPPTPTTRTARVWIGATIGLVLLALILVFVLQNLQDVRLNFLWAHGRFPVGLGLLFAAIGGAAVMVIVGTVRIVQLRIGARRHRRTHQRAQSSVG